MDPRKPMLRLLGVNVKTLQQNTKSALMDPRKPMLRPGVNVKTLQQNTKRGVHGPQKTNVETRCQCEDITTEHKEERSWTPSKPMLSL